MRTDRDQISRSLLSVDETWLWTVFYLVIVIWVSYLLNRALRWDDFEDYLFPYLSITLLLILIALHLVLVWDFAIVRRTVGTLTPESGGVFASIQPDLKQAEEAAKSSVVTDELSPQEERRRLIILSLWVLGLPIVLYYVGFTFGFPLYVFVFSMYATRRVRDAIVVTAIFFVIVFVLFIMLLDVPFWDGVLGLPDLHDLIG